MRNLIIIGAGSLGSGLAIETARRAAALKMPMRITVIDDDDIEERNIYSQEFLPEHVGKKKAEVVAAICAQYDGIEAKALPTRVTEANADDLETDEHTVIVDCVDNFPSRELIWRTGMGKEVPVAHISMSTRGDGLVTWSYLKYNHDTFPLSPKNLTPAKKAELLAHPEDKALAPCELNSMRSLIRNTVMAALDSIFIFLGKDQTKELDLLTEGGPSDGIMAGWYVTLNERKVQLETIGLAH